MEGTYWSQTLATAKAGDGDYFIMEAPNRRSPLPPMQGRPAVKWLGKPAAESKVPGSNPG